MSGMAARKTGGCGCAAGNHRRMDVPLTPKEVRALLAWRFPARLNSVIDTTMSYQRGRNAVAAAEAAVEEQRQALLLVEAHES
jgi:hypothetical protein